MPQEIEESNEVEQMIDNYWALFEVVYEKAPDIVKDHLHLVKDVTTHINMSLSHKQKNSWGHKHATPKATPPPAKMSDEKQQEYLAALIVDADGKHKNPRSIVERALKKFDITRMDELSYDQAAELTKALEAL